MANHNEIKLSELAERLKLDLVGDGSRVIRGVASPGEGRADTLCVVWDEGSAALLASDVPVLSRPEFFAGTGRSGLVSPDPRRALPLLLKVFERPRPILRGVHPSAVVASDADVSADAWVGPCCVVESGAVVEAGVQLVAHVYVGADARVGAGTVVEPQAVLMHGTRVGSNCLLHAHVALGCDGFGFQASPSGIVKVPQIGVVVVGDNVEIGACTTIDRGTIGDTVIENGTKIDNQVQIGHNVRVGRHCIICSMSGIAGSSVVEDGVTISAQAGVTDHVRIGKGATLGGRAGAINDVPAGAVVSGFPARPHGEAKRAQILATRLPDLYDRVRRLERQSGLKPLRKGAKGKMGKVEEEEE